MGDLDEDLEKSADASLDEMMKHLDAAKARRKKRAVRKQRRKRERRKYSGLAFKVRQHHNVAVLTKNYEDRLDELVKYDAITHRHPKEWTAANQLSRLTDNSLSTIGLET
ncbi:hypothetical protein [Haloprofundus halobius]|uniref:hypothetical protein n=1 Tax=Haloprofundus halobius TaxID=2876194 RepID=UPI001CCCB806|nr:hypothetical protein [Haloprofundus halobius]